MKVITHTFVIRPVQPKPGKHHPLVRSLAEIGVCRWSQRRGRSLARSLVNSYDATTLLDVSSHHRSSRDSYREHDGPALRSDRGRRSVGTDPTNHHPDDHDNSSSSSSSSTTTMTTTSFSALGSSSSGQQPQQYRSSDINQPVGYPDDCYVELPSSSSGTTENEWNTVPAAASPSVHGTAGHPDETSSSSSSSGEQQHDNKNHEQQPETALDEPDDELLLTPEVVRALRWSMTLLGFLLIPAAILTCQTTSSYGLVLGSCWLLLGCLFLAFVYFVPTLSTRRPPRPQQRGKSVSPWFPVTRMTVWLVQEYRDFVHDWQQHGRLLLSGTPDDAVFPTTEALRENVPPQQQQQQRRINMKSRLFRAIVQPFLPRMRRRRPEERRSNVTNATTNATAVEMV